MRAGSPSRPGLKPDEELKLPIRPGDIVADKYVVEGILGTGGVGVVVSARHTKVEGSLEASPDGNPDGRVAIKFLQTSAMKSAENIERFDREARAAARIKSEHVAHVIDFGALPNGAPYMVLEHLDGLDLGALLRSQGRVPFEAAVDYVIQACEAVVEAHALGIVHRDLKPANLFLAKRGDGSAIVKVLDFGISKLLAKDGSPIDLAMTQTSSVIGSPLYMSPEQMQSPKDANELSDIWSLGVLLYELMTGSPPFEAATMPLLCAKICVGDPTPMAARFKPGEPPPPVELEAAIMVCLQRDPGQRPGNVAELVKLIAPFGPEGSHAACERITRVAVQAGMTGLIRPMPPTAEAEQGSGRASLASMHAIDPYLTLQEPTPSEGRQWSWTPGQPLGRRVGSRNLALLGMVLAFGFGLGAWGMGARVGVSHARAPANASAGREMVLFARTAIFEIESGMAQGPVKVASPEASAALAVPDAAPATTAIPTTEATATPSTTDHAAPSSPDATGSISAHTDAPTKHHDALPRKSPAAASKKPGAAETTDVLSER